MFERVWIGSTLKIPLKNHHIYEYMLAREKYGLFLIMSGRNEI